MPSSTRTPTATPTAGLAGAAAALELPGPEQLTRQQLEDIYDAFAQAAAASRQDGGDDDDDVAFTAAADGDGVFEDDADAGDGGDDAVVPPTGRDLQWWAWCADHVAAAGPCTGDPTIEAAAALHWNHQRRLAADRGRAATLQADAAVAAQLQRSTAVAAFRGWLAGADGDTRARVTVVTRERAAITTAQAHVADLRAAEAAVGAAGAAQVRGLAVLAPMYAAALDPAVASALDVALGLDLGRLELLGAVADLVAEVAPALEWGEYTTTRRVRLAPRLVTLLPHTMARLEGGELNLARALLIAERTEAADPAVAVRVDELLCGPGGSGVGLNSAQLRDEVDKIVATVDAAAVKERSKRKTAARGTGVRQLADGMARLEITGAAPAVLAAHRALTAVAKVNRAQAQQAAREGRVAADGGDPYAVPGVDVADPADLGDLDALLADRRSVNAHRFDAAVAAVTGARPADGSARPSVSLEFLVSLPGAVGAAEDPRFLVGYGWLPGWLARQGLSWRGCRVRRVLTDPFTGDLITVDGHTYPASWLHGADPDTPDTPDTPGADDPGSGGPASGGPSGAGGSSGPGRPGGSGGSDGSGPGGTCRPDGSGGSSGMTDPGGSSTGSDTSTGSAGSAGSGLAGGSAAPARFRGLPVQQLPPPRTVDDALGAPLSEEELADLTDLAARALSRVDAADDLDDPCAQGTCVPVDPTDCPLHTIGGGRYLPNTAQARHVRLSWGVCTGPGSTTAAAGCDLDHVTAWRGDGSGGSTCSCNLEPKSRRWHTVKHATDRSTWRNPLDPTGAGVAWTRRWAQWRCDHGCSHWLSPLGRAHHTRPRPIAEPAGPFRRLVAPAAPPPPMLAAHLTSSSRQQHRDDETTARPFPAQPDF